jgi:hypothetical protein
MCVKFVSAALTAVALATAPVLLSASDKAVTAKNGKTVQSTTVEKASSQFATLKGINAVPMASSELKAIKGLHVHFFNGSNNTQYGFPGVHLAGRLDEKNWFDNGSPDGNLVAPSYHGLCVAAGSGSAISIPTFGGPSQCP